MCIRDSTFGLSKDNYLAAMKEVRGNQRVTDDNPEGKYQTLEKYLSLIHI